jgi:DNA-directed RNA polymerase specialized sigma24 family protein
MQQSMREPAPQFGVWQSEWMQPAAERSAEHEREQRLVAQARAGSDWALAALETRYQPLVVRYLAHLTGSPEHARPLTDEIFVRMERHLYGPQGLAQARLWLLRATTDAGLAHLRNWRAARPARMPAPTLMRRGASRPVAPTLPRAVAPTADERDHRPDHSPNHSAEEMQTALGSADPREALRQRLVRTVLAELPPDDARCLALHLVAGLSHIDVAQVMDLAPATARERIIHGVQLFAMRYDDALDALGMPPGFVTGFAPGSAEALAARERPAPTSQVADHVYEGARTLVRRSEPNLIPALPRREHEGSSVSAVPVTTHQALLPRRVPADSAPTGATQVGKAPASAPPAASAATTVIPGLPPRPLPITSPRGADHSGPRLPTSGSVVHVPVVSGGSRRPAAPAVPSVPVRSPAVSRR